MTVIKGPDHTLPRPSDFDMPGTGAAGAITGAGEGATGAGATTGASGAAGATVTDPIAALARAIGDGSLTVEQAIDVLIDRAAGQAPVRLTDAERGELVTLLRGALADDPALRSLRESVR